MSTDKPLPPPPPRGRHREVWVGLFVVAGLLATLVTLAVMTDAALFRGRYIVTSRVENASGIRKGDPVQMRGVNIGRILAFTILEQGVVMKLEIEGEYPIPKDSQVIIRSSGLLTGMVANVIQGTSPQPVGRGGTLPGSLAAHEKTVIEDALRASGGRVFGPAGAAQRLGIPRSTLESRIRALKINKNRFRTRSAQAN